MTTTAIQISSKAKDDPNLVLMNQDRKCNYCGMDLKKGSWAIRFGTFFYCKALHLEHSDAFQREKERKDREMKVELRGVC